MHLWGVLQRGLAFRAWSNMTIYVFDTTVQDELTAEQHKEEPVAEEEPAEEQEHSDEPAADEGDDEEEAEAAPEIVVRGYSCYLKWFGSSTWECLSAPLNSHSCQARGCRCREQTNCQQPPVCACRSGQPRTTPASRPQTRPGTATRATMSSTSMHTCKFVQPPSRRGVTKCLWILHMCTTLTKVVLGRHLITPMSVVRCAAEAGEDDDKCKFYQRAYRSICPGEWVRLCTHNLSDCCLCKIALPCWLLWS